MNGLRMLNIFSVASRFTLFVARCSSFVARRFYLLHLTLQSSTSRFMSFTLRVLYV